MPTDQSNSRANDEQTLEYTYDMLRALKDMAAARGHDALAQLLTAAAAEARSIIQVGRANARRA
jgi:hypothetical protein